MNDMGDSEPILERWADARRRRGGESAIFDPSGRVLRTFDEIGAEADRWAEQMAGIGLAPGSVVGLCSGNTAVWPGILIGLLRAGATVLPMGIHMDRGEWDRVLVAAGASGVVESVGQELDGRDARYRAVGIGGAAGAMAGLDGRCRFLKLTSGTTSAPKLIQFTQEQLVADCDAVCESMGIREEDLNYGAIPFSHSYGFSNLVTPLICRGVRLVVSNDCLPRALLGGFARTGATVFPGMPVIFQALSGGGGMALPDALRLCISAGAPLGVNVARRFTAWCGRRIHTFYGASECGGIAYDDAEEGDYEPGYVGRSMGRVMIGVVGGGRIAVSGAAVGLGYYPDAEPEVLGNGTFFPGDLVQGSESGWRIVGRVSDAINVAGRKVNPVEVENGLAGCPGVRQVVVFGVPSPTRNEAIVACVAGGVAVERLKAHAAERLGAWQLPRYYWVVGEIPHNERGKVSRTALAEAFLGSGAPWKRS
jgi:acyl-CoA synthetase (AMP-forming)/AMP-acid ligase II